MTMTDQELKDYRFKCDSVNVATMIYQGKEHSAINYAYFEYAKENGEYAIKIIARAIEILVDKVPNIKAYKYFINKAIVDNELSYIIPQFE